MLFDPKWETKVDPLSDLAFVEWLEKQPPEKAYDFLHCLHCAVGQYAASIGTNYYKLSPDVCDRWNTVASRGDWTFGEAARRARKMLAL
jgi:hypothetical protein